MINPSARSGCKVVFDGPRELRLVPMALPERAPEGRVLLATRVTMISTGTELAFYDGYHAGLGLEGNTWAKYPFEPGYAAVSEVVDVGAGVEGFWEGGLVFHWGRHASWSVVDPSVEVVLGVAEGLDVREVLLARFAQIASTAVWRVGLVPRSVLVMGAGLIGILAGRAFEMAGVADVMVQDVLSSRLKVAAAVGLKTRLAGASGGWAADFRPDCVVEATGVKGVIGQALGAVAQNGTVVMLGSPGGEQTINLYRDVFGKSVALVGAHEGRVPVMGAGGRREMNVAAMGAIARGELRVRPLITGEVGYRDIECAYHKLLHEREANLATVVVWGE